MDQRYEILRPSEAPIHSNMWVGRDPTNRELSDEFANLYRLVASLQERIKFLEELLEE